jgi:hypothetical protein
VLQALIDEYGITRLARRLDPTLKKQALYQWPHVPERWVARVAQVTGLSRHKLRPDLFARNGRRLNGR